MASKIIHFGKNLKYLRKSERLGQQEIADLLGVNNSSVSMYEKGENYPKIPAVAVIAQKFNVRVEDLLFVDLEENPEQANQIDTIQQLKAELKKKNELNYKLKIQITDLQSEKDNYYNQIGSISQQLLQLVNSYEKIRVEHVSMQNFINSKDEIKKMYLDWRD